MKVSEMQEKLVQYTSSLFSEGYLDGQFTQLQQLQDDSNPGFVMEVITLFFEDSERILRDLASALHQQVVDFQKVDAHVHQLKGSSSSHQQVVDFQKVDAHVHQLKGSSSSIGAQRVKNACVNFRSFCDEQNADGCRACLQQVNQEFIHVKNKLQILFNMEQQIVSAGGTIPIPE